MEFLLSRRDEKISDFVHGKNLMTLATNALWVIGVPLIGCLTLPIVALISPKFRNGWAVVLAAATALLSAGVGAGILGGQQAIVHYPMWDSLEFVLVVDGLGAFMAMTSSFISLLIVIYSLGYIHRESHQTEYYLILLMFVGAMMGLVFSGNLFMMFVFWEIAGIACWRLIGFYRVKDHVVKGGKAFLVTAFGALMMLLGFLMVLEETGTADLTQLHGASVSSLAVLLILFGVLSKSAPLPLHTWLPDAGVAPSPVTALLHAAVLVKIGLFGFARMFCGPLLLPEVWQQWLPILVGVSALVSAGAACVETDIKRIIAYSTVSQIGFIFLGFAIGTPIGVAGAMLYLLMHGLGKAGLFLCAGIVEHNTGTKDIRKLGGLVKTMPFTAFSFAFCAFSIMGIPPFGGFFAKYQVIAGAVEGGRPLVAVLFMGCAVMTILYLFRVFNRVFLAPLPEGGIGEGAREHSVGMVSVVVILALLSLAGGLFIAYPAHFVELAQAPVLAAGSCGLP